MSGLAPDDPRHGTTNGYGNYGCRCEACCRANTEAMRDYRRRHPEQQEKARLREAARRGEPGAPRRRFRRKPSSETEAQPMHEERDPAS
jgi:hypothetical protein